MGGLIAGIVPILIVYCVLRVVYSLSKKNDIVRGVSGKPFQTDFQVNTERIKSQVSKPRTTGVSAGMHGGTAGSAGADRSELSVRYTMEDRKHDWLAKQLADERIAKKRMKDMFGFKDVHPEHCDAMAIRNEHAANCDAHGIDTATKQITKVPNLWFGTFDVI